MEMPILYKFNEQLNCLVNDAVKSTIYINILVNLIILKFNYIKLVNGCNEVKQVLGGGLK